MPDSSSQVENSFHQIEICDPQRIPHPIPTFPPLAGRLRFRKRVKRPNNLESPEITTQFQRFRGVFLRRNWSTNRLQIATTKTPSSRFVIVLAKSQRRNAAPVGQVRRGLDLRKQSRFPVRVSFLPLNGSRTGYCFPDLQGAVG